MNIGIEDFVEDIVGKAMRGLGISAETLGESSGVPIDKIEALLGGAFDEEVARKIAEPLGLGADALVESGKKLFNPVVDDVAGLRIYNTPFGDMRVNAFLVWDPETKDAAVFDTGSDATGIIADATEFSLNVSAVYLTHTHADHVADLDRVWTAFPRATFFVGSKERDQVSGQFLLVGEGDDYRCGGLTIKTLLTTGHSVGGITYFIEGLSKPIAIVGDSMFAGSMGGGKISYQDALANNRTKILTLPDDTILCPGHGPMSTVGQEKLHNPFFP